jgi:hypothetical protein
MDFSGSMNFVLQRRANADKEPIGVAKPHEGIKENF